MATRPAFEPRRASDERPAVRAAGRPVLPRRPFVLNGRTLLALAAGALLAWSLGRAGLLGAARVGEIVNPGGWELVRRFLRASLHPDTSLDTVRLAAQSAGATLVFAVCGTVLAVLGGAVWGVLASRTWGRLRRGRPGRASGGMWLAVRALLALPRGIHEAVWGLLLLGVLGLDPLVPILAIAIPYGAITARVYAEILDETPPEPLFALAGAGVPPFRALVYGLLPPALPALASYALYRLECALRSATVLGLIGAGGLGYQILLSLQTLRYEQVWTFLYVLIALVGLTDALSAWVNRRLHVGRQTEVRVAAHPAPTPVPSPQVGKGPTQAGKGCLGHSSSSASHQAVAEPGGRHPSPAAGEGTGVGAGWAATRLTLVLFSFVLITLAFRYSGASLASLTSERTLRLGRQTLSDLFPPYGDRPLLSELGALALDTLAMSVLAITLAGVLGLLASFFAAPNLVLGKTGTSPLGRRLVGAVVVVVTRGVLLVFRALSESVWALLALFVLFPGVLPGAVALGFYNAGVLGRLMSEVNENADARPRRALAALGARGAPLLAYSLLPLSLPRCLAYTLYRWEVCVRATAVVGIVGAGGLGRQLAEQLTAFDYPAVTTTLLFYLGLTLLVDGASMIARRAAG